MKRTIVFGDIHGCHGEWQDLLDRLAVTREDRLVCVGDLICKGPSTRHTLELARRLGNLTCLVGNHEYRFLQAWRRGRVPSGRNSDERTVRDMGRSFDELMAFIATWPFYADLPEALVVHAGLRPGIPLKRQKPEDLLHIRRVGARRRPWYAHYSGRKPVVFGHWVHREPILEGRAIGIDTGCVYGGFLTAAVFPEGGGRRLLQVKARRAYASKKGGWQ